MINKLYSRIDTQAAEQAQLMGVQPSAPMFGKAVADKVEAGPSKAIAAFSSVSQAPTSQVFFGEGKAVSGNPAHAAGGKKDGIIDSANDGYFGVG